MEKIRSLRLSLDAAKGGGYDLSYSVYCYGDRSPREHAEYERLVLAEVLQAIEDLLNDKRPGWEYTPHFQQPPLWELD